MKRLSLALALAVLLLLTVGVATATASPPAGQSSGQSAGSDQDAGAVGGTAQTEASNSSQPIRVLSPGESGDVSQTNEASSNATAANENSTEQTVDQDNVGASGTQIAGQSVTNEQDALALGLTLQKGASNENAPVDVLSPSGKDEKDEGKDEKDDEAGSVSQENAASSNAAAGNSNETEQTVDQETEGSCSTCGGAGTQVAGQSASNDQEATAVSATEQENPSNTNVSIRVLSPGDDGDVSQTNEASSNATAANTNEAEQTADQDAGGQGGTQVIGQSADSDQDALAAASTKQEDPKNENISIRVLSPGKGGSVTQSNVASSNATAANENSTEQTAEQEQTGDACKCKGAGTQIIGQSASNDQEAAALSATKQEKPSNTNVSIRVLSEGNDGDVTQSNVASSNAVAGNSNETTQSAQQGQGGGAGTQIVGQSASNSQDAFALGFTAQKGASNVNTGIRVLSPGHGGSVTQSNTASSNASAGNANTTEQAAGQSQAGDSCKCGGSGVQIIGQSAKSEQHAAALAATLQLEPSNVNAPVRVLSKGNDGDVSQSNDASSNAIAANENETEQSAEQSQAGGSGLQVIGQSSHNGQFAAAAALTAQIGARNENAPVRVLSPGYGGSVSQENTASSNAVAGNSNSTDQDADQEHGSDTKGHCCGAGIQVIGQSSSNWQGAKALALTLQVGAKPPCKCGDEGGFGNSNTPTRVLSPGADGDVSQSNKATSNATAANFNETNQDANQILDRSVPCRCKPTGIQVIGQYAASAQLAAALAATLQLDAHNRFAPERKESPGKNESLHQKDRDAEGDKSGSSTSTNQSRNQVER